MANSRESRSNDSVHYDASYGNFHSQLYAEIRKEAAGEDLGQTSWLTADEQDRFLEPLALAGGKKLLDVACGAGGPALRIAAKTGCDLVGIDLHEQAVAAANILAEEKGLAARTQFRVANAAESLPFADQEFHAITCIDAINHLPDRPRLIKDWARLMRSGGRLLFTNSTVITGPLTKEEISIRSSIGFFLFVPPLYDRDVLASCGFHLLVYEDVTQNMADLATRRHAARERRSDALRQIEGDEAFEHQQAFLDVAARIARERRLSRFLYIAEKSS